MRQTYLPNQNAQQSGFTLVELIMVIVMLGILSIYAAPRLFNSGDFYARGFHDETLALLRYAQKAAIAQRRTVCVAFTSNTVSLTMARDPAITNCDTPTTPALTGPNGAATITARPGVTYKTATPATWNFNFDGLGQPRSSTSGVLLGSRTDIAINNASPVFVEAVTGYVHDD